MERILEIINKICLNKQLESVIAVTESTHLRDNLGLDSFDLAELTIQGHKEYL